MLCIVMTMHQFPEPSIALPQLAVILANNLRQATGDQKIFALVEGTDYEAEVPEDRAHINVGYYYGHTESVIFVLYMPAAPGGNWQVERAIYYPGSYWEPPSMDAEIVLETPHLNAVFKCIADDFYNSRFEGVLEAFDYDWQMLYFGEPLI